MDKFFLYTLVFLSTQLLHAQSKSDSLQKHVIVLTSIQPFQNENPYFYLNKRAEYIRSRFSQYSKKVFYQKYEYNHQVVQNVITSLGADTGSRIIIGAPYDMMIGAEGADMNASGVASLLELCRIFSTIKNIPYRIDLVAYTLSETPNIPQQFKGSYQHAKSLADNKISVMGMLLLYGIGYYSDNAHSQKYPRVFMKPLYRNKGNFLCLYRKWKSPFFAREMNRLIIQYVSQLKVKQWAPLIPYKQYKLLDISAYEQYQIPTVLIHNTGSLRNPYINTLDDTYDKLDYKKMSYATDAIFQAITHYRP